MSIKFGLISEYAMSLDKLTRRSLRRPFETGGFRFLQIVIPILPRRGVIGLSRLAGRLAMLLPLREKRIGMKNLDAVFDNQKSGAEKRRILQASFATFTQTMLDVIWFSRKPDRRISTFVTFEDGPLKVRFFEERPVICITAHLGNWELLGQTCAWMGVDLASIAAPVKNDYVDRILIRNREQTGQSIIPQKGALKLLISRLRRNGKAAFVLDQKTAENEGGIVTDFLGLPMPVSPAPAALAYRTGTEIMFGFCLPEPGGRYRIRITDCLSPPPFEKGADSDHIILELTRQIQDRISAEILRHPQFWLWSYKHWRRVPGRTYPDHFPAY